MRLLLFAVALLVPLAPEAQPSPDPLVETRVSEVRSTYSLTGEGVIVCVLDRGLDVEHEDFRNADGTTRVLGIYDLLAPEGSQFTTREQIDAALSAGTRIAHRDAVGHGTATMGIAAGNGRASGGTYMGPAPEADLLVIKMVSEGAPAVNGEPAEAPGNAIAQLPAALDWAIGMAQAEGKPIVFLANFGSIGGPTDGTSDFAQALNARFGAGQPGRVFITGSGDDGGHPNHASGLVAQGATSEIGIEKGSPGVLRFDLWYEANDRFEVEIVTPQGVVGPFAAPNNGIRDTQTQGGVAGFTYYHNGAGTVFYGTSNGKREILIDLAGQVGTYAVRLRGTSISDGRFHASLNPARIFPGSDQNRLTGPFVTAQSSIWYGATATSNIAPNSYVHRPTWVDINGETRMDVGNDVTPGSLWPGSSIGPTYDGRLGTTVSVPGNTNIGAYARRSFFASLPHTVVQDGENPYGTLGAVSGAAPVLTGIVALMLEANPTLDASQVKQFVQDTAREDAFTGTVPNPVWGYGKVDALRAVEAAFAGTDTAPTAEASGVALRVSANPSRVPRVRLALDAPQAVRVSVFDALGREVAVLHDGPLARDAEWPLRDLTPGVYVVRVSTPEAEVMARATVVG